MSTSDPHNSSDTFDIRDAFFDSLYEIASKDEKVMFLTADMDAFSLRKFRKELKKRDCSRITGQYFRNSF
jgi:deoxyxylulose-5-phosphate synthase